METGWKRHPASGNLLPMALTVAGEGAVKGSGQAESVSTATRPSYVPNIDLSPRLRTPLPSARRSHISERQVKCITSKPSSVIKGCKSTPPRQFLLSVSHPSSTPGPGPIFERLPPSPLFNLSLRMLTATPTHLRSSPDFSSAPNTAVI